jgi:metal-responsive CopG/Arc/MetJ family transcriptional regulator
MVRMNITIPEELARKLDEIVSSRKKSRFIADSVRDRIKRIEKEEREKKLAEGYKARKEEALAIAEDFRSADLEGWDDY